MKNKTFEIVTEIKRMIVFLKFTGIKVTEIKCIFCFVLYLSIS